jgi:hypothetical protein
MPSSKTKQFWMTAVEFAKFPQPYIEPLSTLGYQSRNDPPTPIESGSMSKGASNPV